MEKKMIDKIKEAIACYKDKIKELQKENTKLKNTVEFYASEDNWIGWHRDVDMIRNDTEPTKANDGFDIMLGGKRARQTLKDLNKD